jgi:hypothetical protein
LTSRRNPRKEPPSSGHGSNVTGFCSATRMAVAVAIPEAWLVVGFCS